jgi:hypothetical protein
MIQLPAILSGFSSTSDGGASLRFHTNELQASDFAILKDFQGKFGFVCFKENEFAISDMPTEQAEDRTKTPSKRLRASLFVLYEQEGEPGGDFEAYYRGKVEKLIDFVKSKLD